MSKLINRRAAMMAGRKLNELVDALRVKNPQGPAYLRLMAEKEAEEIAEAVRIANEVIWQYNNIPRDVREFWWTGYEEVNEDGVPVQDLPEE